MARGSLPIAAGRTGAESPRSATGAVARTTLCAIIRDASRRPPIHQIPIKNLISEDGAHELATSPDMKPYLKFIKAVIQDHDPAPELEAILRLPLERRTSGGWRLL